jgi:hypothetical protein
VRLAQQALIGVVERLAQGGGDCECHHALANAFITSPDKIPSMTLKRLWPLVGKYFKQ